ncbi:serine hydrolase [Oerskovia flava]|uniref:serine hydrolase n=1 Tax=Oerskovia flava TaxID=2986422 RepID=UPI0022401A26|nr:Cpe/LpqF family protein [Oerskovia sp. JB1-3-2]
MTRPGPRSGTRPSRAALHATAVAATAALVVAGCSGGEEAPEPSPAPTTSASAAPEAVGLPDSPVGEAAGWVVDVLDGEDPPTTDEITERFAGSFLAQVPAEQLTPIFTQLQGDRPWTVVAVTPADATDAAEVTLVGTSGQFMAMQVGLDADGLVETLFFGPGVDPDRPAASTWDELGERVDGLGATSAVLVARVDDGECVPVEGAPGGSEGADEALPLASVAKLYVLGAVALAVEAGGLAWDDELELTDDVRSLPSGTLQDEPSGTTVTVEEAATLMISISDNTATDLLVQTVGREAVEAAQVEMGASDPDRNTPFPTTRDLFRLGWGDADARERWAAAGTDERRDLLAALPDGELDVDVAAITQPVWQDGVDWFATPADVCAAHVWLQETAETAHGAPLRAVLSENPGIEVDQEDWPYLAFKGGSSPGVLTGSWLGEDADGARTVVVVQLASDDVAALANPAELVSLGQSAFALAAEGDDG